MIINIKNLKINVHVNEYELNKKIPILFLHGFTGSLEDWKFLENKLPSKFSPIFIDLIGHGKSASPNNIDEYSFTSQIEIINQLLKKIRIEKLVIAGYSMGGRLALSFAMEYPEKLLGLILESTSFGIENNEERTNRIANDGNLAKQISNSQIEGFIDYWLQIPLFNSLKNISDERFEELRIKKIKNNNNLGLQNSLLGFSTGKMKNYYPYCSSFNISTFLICGELDTKFTEISKKAHSLLLNSKINIIKDCGHNVHLEKPEEFLKLLNKILLNIRE